MVIFYCFNIDRRSPQSGAWSLDLSDTTYYSIAQAVPTTIGQCYYLSFWLQENYGGAFNKTGYAQATGGANQTFFYNPLVYPTGKWVQITYNFTATVASTIIEIGGTTFGSCGPVLDNAMLNTYVAPTCPTTAPTGLVASGNLLVNGDFENYAGQICTSQWCLISQAAAIQPWYVSKSALNTNTFELDNSPSPW